MRVQENGGPRQIFIPSSDIERAIEAAWRSIPLFPNEVKLQIIKLINPRTLKILCAVGVTSGVMHFFGAGEAFDVIIFGIGVIAVGGDFIIGANNLRIFYNKSKTAKSEEDLNEAAQYFAHGVMQMGIATLMVYLMRAGPKKTIPSIVEDVKSMAAVAEFPPCTNGALWSSLGKNGAVLAEKLAKKDQLVTLEIILKNKHPDLFARLTSLNGAVEWMDLKPIWELLSENYGKSLRGKVTVYTDMQTLLNRIRGATPIPFPKTPDLADNPILAAEIDAITDNIFSTNPSVKSILVRDIQGKMGGFIVDKKYGTTH